MINRIGETSASNDGHKMTIITYRQSVENYNFNDEHFIKIKLDSSGLEK